MFVLQQGWLKMLLSFCSLYLKPLFLIVLWTVRRFRQLWTLDVSPGLVASSVASAWTFEDDELQDLFFAVGFVFFFYSSCLLALGFLLGRWTARARPTAGDARGPLPDVPVTPLAAKRRHSTPPSVLRSPSLSLGLTRRERVLSDPPARQLFPVPVIGQQMAPKAAGENGHRWP